MINEASLQLKPKMHLNTKKLETQSFKNSNLSCRIFISSTSICFSYFGLFLLV